MTDFGDSRLEGPRIAPKQWGHSANGGRAGQPPLVAKGLILGRLLAQTTDRRVAHVVGPSDVGQHLSCLTASDRFSFLMAGQLGFPTEYYPPRLCPCPPLAVPLHIGDMAPVVFFLGCAGSQS